MITLTIGRREKVEVVSISQAVRTYVNLRIMSEEGASTFPQGKLVVKEDGKSTTYRISHNGRVWNKDGTEFVG